MEVCKVTATDLNICLSDGKELGREFYCILYDKLIRMYQELVQAHNSIPYSFGKKKSMAIIKKKADSEFELEELQELIFMVKLKLLSLDQEEVMAPKIFIYDYSSNEY